jgi:hypothetical protein
MAGAYSPTYSELVLELQDICENTNSEFVSNLPRFIHRAQDTVMRDLGLEIFRDYEVSTIATAAYTRSEDWLVVRSLYLPVSNRYLEKRHIDYVRQYGSVAGTPKVWAEDQETTLLVAPAPSTTLSIRVEYMKRLAPLAATSNENNWVTRNAGDLLLMQALINAFMYEVAPERAAEIMGVYQGVLPTAVSELRAGERKSYEPIKMSAKPAQQAGASA